VHEAPLAVEIIEVIARGYDIYEFEERAAVAHG